MLNVSKPVAYLILMISVISEIIGTSCLEACDGFQDKKLTVAVIICYVIAFTLYTKILHIINLSIAYATWSALGAITIALIGTILFDQQLTIIGWISIFAMGFGVFMLNLYGSAEKKESK